MSEFLLVIPEGWTQIDLDAAMLIPGFGTSAIQCWIESGYLEIMATELINGGLLPEGSIISEARLFNGETFMVKLV